MRQPEAPSVKTWKRVHNVITTSKSSRASGLIDVIFGKAQFFVADALYTPATRTTVMFQGESLGLPFSLSHLFPGRQLDTGIIWEDLTCWTEKETKKNHRRILGRHCHTLWAISIAPRCQFSMDREHLSVLIHNFGRWMDIQPNSETCFLTLNPSHNNKT